MHTSDEQLLNAVSQKQASAFSDLYDRYSRLLYGTLLNIVRDTDDAEDLLQEVFVQIWNAAATYNPALGSAKGWMIRIARNRAINLLHSKRHQQKQMEVELPDENGSEILDKQFHDGGTLKQVVRSEEEELLNNALGALPQEQRCLIELAFLEGYSHSEIAEKLSLPLGTVKTRIRSGMISLREQLRFIEES
ncbi:MAG TPA: sigma-70 family RNA polymerase sigma factor [Candidatus Kapabacteria bacterium]|nr:sigma-70 family RNA polymerase sigma factor [Candidatus Kapabacteria bacterium]